VYETVDDAERAVGQHGVTCSHDQRMRVLGGPQTLFDVGRCGVAGARHGGRVELVPLHGTGRQQDMAQCVEALQHSVEEPPQ